MRKIWILAAFAAMFASCSNDQDAPSVEAKGDVALTVKGSANEVAITRANVELTAGAKVGVYAYLSDNTTTLSTTPFKNVLYTATGASGAFNATTPIYLNHLKSYKALAYAPQTTASDVAAVPFKHGDDVLYAPVSAVAITGTGTTVDPYLGTTAFVFSHKMSQIKFTLVAGAGTPDLTGAVLAVTGFNESCTLNLNDGAITPVIGNGAAITEADKAICFAANSTDMLLDVKITLLDGRVCSGTISRVFSAGNSYSYTLEVVKNDTKLGITGTVVDWIPVDGGSVPVEG